MKKHGNWAMAIGTVMMLGLLCVTSSNLYAHEQPCLSPCPKEEPQKIFSIAELDGFIRNDFTEKKESMNITSRFLEAMDNQEKNVRSRAFITFDLSEIDLERARSIALYVNHVNAPEIENMQMRFWQIQDADYAQWKNCTVVKKFETRQDSTGRTVSASYIKYVHEPPSCGFTLKADQNCVDVIRYNHLPRSKITMSEKGSGWWGAEDLLPIIKEHYLGKKYLTIELMPKAKTAGSKIVFQSGFENNLSGRPRLEITY